MIKIREFHRPKLGNVEGEYEDAFAFNMRRKRFAMADGASESVFSGIWARALVNSFVNSRIKLSDPAALAEHMLTEARSSWYDSIKWDELKLFVKNKAVKGSFSTFLGIEFTKGKSSYSYSVVALGDTCFLTSRNNAMISRPIETAADFNITPKLFWSGYGAPFEKTYKWKIPQMLEFSGEIEFGENLIMATDALSKWILENNFNSWEILTKVDEPAMLFNSLLQHRMMRNDDITLAVLTLQP